jgi:5-methylcytosine-specific restriction endonuclease McrA
MLWGMGIYPTVQFKAKRARHREFWTLILQGENYSRFMRLALKEDPGEDGKPVFGDADFVYRKFQELEPTAEPTLVYNLETTGTHSYIANGLAVHNCQYCGEHFGDDELTYDHVVPQSRGGRTCWTNIVTACCACNNRKDNRTPDEAEMNLLSRPKQPRWMPASLVDAACKREIPPQWVDWVGWMQAAA